jgi:hypothetical protein
MIADKNHLFKDGDNKTNAASDPDLASRPEEIDSETDDDASLFADEVQHPPENHLIAVAKLDMRRLRLRRCSPKSRNSLIG